MTEIDTEDRISEMQKEIKWLRSLPVLPDWCKNLKPEEWRLLDATLEAINEMQRRDALRKSNKKVSLAQVEAAAKAMFESNRWHEGILAGHPAWAWENFPDNEVDPRKYWLRKARVAIEALGLEIEGDE